MYTPSRRKNESLLDYAARLVLVERDDLVDSTPPGILRRLEAIAKQLREVEDML